MRPFLAASFSAVLALTAAAQTTDENVVSRVRATHKQLQTFIDVIGAYLKAHVDEAVMRIRHADLCHRLRGSIPSAAEELCGHKSEEDQETRSHVVLPS